LGHQQLEAVELLGAVFPGGGDLGFKLGRFARRQVERGRSASARSAGSQLKSRRRGDLWSAAPGWITDDLRWPQPTGSREWGVDAGVGKDGGGADPACRGGRTGQGTRVGGGYWGRRPGIDESDTNCHRLETGKSKNKQGNEQDRRTDRLTEFVISPNHVPQPFTGAGVISPDRQSSHATRRAKPRYNERVKPRYR